MYPSHHRASPHASTLLHWFAVIALAAAICVLPRSDARADDDGRVRIMTQNMFEGTNFIELLSATTPLAFLQAVTTTFQGIQATKPAERAAAVADEIAKARPDFVAIQEATILRTGASAPATTVVSDQLQLLLDALAARGLRYEAVLIVPNQDAEAPSTLGFDIRITDRTTIIARRNGDSDDVKLSNIQVQEFLANQVFKTAVGVSVVETRGWGSVDVTMRGGTFRLVTTHLTTPVPGPTPAATQQLQAAELVHSALNTSLPVVVVGDFNVTADSGVDPTFATYQLLIGAGLIDLWPQKGGSDPGFTCCQDATLLNPVSQLSHRVDLVLYRGNFTPLDIFLVGNTPADRTPSGFWPSDHAGVVATLRIPQTQHAAGGN